MEHDAHDRLDFIVLVISKVLPQVKEGLVVLVAPVLAVHRYLAMRLDYFSLEIEVTNPQILHCFRIHLHRQSIGRVAG